MVARKTQAQFEQEVKQFEQRGVILVDGQKYINNATKYKWKCAHDGHEWDAIISSVVRGTGCPECARRALVDFRTLPEAEFLAKLEERNLDHQPVVQYVADYSSMSEKCSFGCTKCDHQWTATPQSICQGHGCPKCGKMAAVKSRQTDEVEFKRKLAIRNTEEQHPIELVEGTYVKYRNVKATFSCHNGHQWDAQPISIINDRTKCPVCIGRKR